MAKPFEELAVQDKEEQRFRDAVGPKKTKVAVCIENTTAIPVVLADGDDLNGDTTTTVTNTAVALASTEVSFALPSDCKGFMLRARGKSRVQLSFSIGTSGTTFVTIPPGANYEDRNFRSSQTLYFQTSKAGETIEIIAYT